MKKIFIITFIFFAFVNYSYAWINPTITLTWTTLEDISWVWNGWKLVFPSTSWVVINASSLDSNANSNISISWNFWLQNVSSVTDASLWWATFDIWVVTWAPKVVLVNNLNNTFTFSWYAWSNAAGWIYFSSTNLVAWDNNTKVVYDRNLERVNWCAWSQNLGWICIDNYFLDTTPIDVTSAPWTIVFWPSVTDNAKNIVLPETITNINVENWNSIATSTYTSSNFIHDFRKSKTYNITWITDTSWNISNPTTMKIVSWVPTTILDSNNIWWGATASTITNTFLTTKIANWNDKHHLSFKLRDKYGNPVISESWIKDVNVTLSFLNDMDADQIDNLDLWDAISYSNNQFWLLNWLISNIWTSNNTITWNYSVDISSIAPTKVWYSYTTNNNDISLDNVQIDITWWAWVWWTIVPYNNFFNVPNKLIFIPVVKVDSISNDLSWNIPRDVETFFTWSISINTPISISNIQVQNVLDTMSWWLNKNMFISFQNLWSTNWTNICTWNNVPNFDNTSYNYISTLECNNYSLDGSSNIITSHNWTYNSTTNISDWFKATPKVVLAWIPSFDVMYSSNIFYTKWLKTIKYPSFTNLFSNSLLNNWLKVSWIVNSNNSHFSVIANESIDYIWSLDKNTLFTNIRKNAYLYQKAWVWTHNGIMYLNSNYNLNSWPVWVDTILVIWADVIVNSDISKTPWKVKSIIALKWNTTNKWNIWVKDNVKNISATLVSDRSILSWDGTNTYVDNYAKNQLYIKWSLLSYNTIGWSSSATPICPFYVTTCNFNESKKYDLNKFRYFIKWLFPWSESVGIPMISWYDEAPMIVEYDSDIQINTPKIFLNWN